MNHLLKRLLLVTIVTLSLGLVAGPAVAANAHVVKGPTADVANNTLVVTLSIAGLGNVPTVELTLEGTVDVFSRCYNNGGNKPAADNKQETIEVSSTDTFDVRNGRTNAVFRITPLSTLECPGKQVVVIESVSWDDLTVSGPGGLGPFPIPDPA